MSYEPGSRRALLYEFLRSLAWVGLPFFVAIAALALHRAGVLPRNRHVAYERSAILALGIYWLIAAVLWLAWRRRHAVTRWLRSDWPSVVLLAVTLSLSLVGVEVALRVLRPQQAARPFERLSSPTRHHVNAPSRSGAGMGESWVRTNADGFRVDFERDEFLEADERVALLGDSYVFGLGVDAEVAVAEVLRERLQDTLDARSVADGGPPRTVRVLNAGVISYSPLLERQTWIHAVRDYRPTATVLVLDVNDIGDDVGYARQILEGTADPETVWAGEGVDALRFDVPPPDDSYSLCERSAVCRLSAPLFERLARPIEIAKNLAGLERLRSDYYDFEVEVAGRTETDRFFVLRHPLEDTRPYFERSWAAVEDLAERVARDRSSFAVAVTPRYFHWDDEASPENWEAHRYAVDEPYEMEWFRFFDEVGATAPFPVWSLLSDFEGRTDELTFRTDAHWTAAGHRLVGEALARRLLDAGWPEPAAVEPTDTREITEPLGGSP